MKENYGLEYIEHVYCLTLLNYRLGQRNKCFLKYALNDRQLKLIRSKK